jgi:urease accessory protein
MMRSIIPGVVATAAASWFTAAAVFAALVQCEGPQLTSFAGGLTHPLSGLDHILAMAAVGVWSVLAGGRALWVWPLAFVVTMLAGFAAATAGLALPGVPAVIPVSIIVLGLALALAVKAPVWLGAAVVGLFAFFHGHVHGTEATGGSHGAYAAGFVVATAGLHAAGIGLGFIARGSIGTVALRVCGALALCGGVALIAGPM